MRSMTRQFATRAMIVLLSALIASLNEAQSTTTTTPPAAEEEVIVNPEGTCGKGGGDRGNGICANGKCCSKFGWCGITPAHCSGETFPPTLSPAPSISISISSGSPTTTTIPIPTTSEPATASPTTTLPTLLPTSRDWSLLTPGHTSFCGPKIVGGYEIAKATCSFNTECQKSMANDTHFGANGNDCPEPFMCFTDIICEPPTSSPSYMPSSIPSISHSPTVTVSDPPSSLPSMSSFPTPKGQTKHPTYLPTVSNDPTFNPTVNPDNIVNSMTTRASFCGSSYEMAVNSCSEATLCTTDEDCSSSSAASDALCFPDISCSSDATEWSDNNNNNINSLNNGGQRRIHYYWSGVSMMMVLLLFGDLMII